MPMAQEVTRRVKEDLARFDEVTRVLEQGGFTARTSPAPHA